MNKPLIICGILLSLSLLGCQSISKHKDDKVERDWLGREKPIEYGTPSKIVAIWSNSVFNRPGEPPVRGLGGRVYFYDGEHHPVRVNGKLAVYLYDDTNPTDRVKQEATKVVHFSTEEVAANYSPSEFGASYSFWVPWDHVTGDRKQLSVIPVFTDDLGQMLVGDQARHLLPGSDPIEFADAKDKASGDVAQAGFSSSNDKGSGISLASGEAPSKRVLGNSVTIKIPETMQARLRQAPPRKRRSWNIRERTEATTSWRLGAPESSSKTEPGMGLPSTPSANNTSDPFGQARTATPRPSNATEVAATDTTTNSPQSIRLPQRPLQAPSSPFSQPAGGRAQSLLAPGEQLFGH